MPYTAVQVDSIGKEYTLGLREKSRQTFRETIVDLAAAPLRRLKQLSGESREGRFWALRDVSFDVPEGEVLGIIGHNGAGKSTLLKILSRITEPTEGRAIVRGRVASLLEVGTGFHPELSGRENVYLNGAILGMSRSEIDVKFDEIVDFAGVEQFLDTPIKRYSSGMKVRLAFAVAAHLEPEVLIIDEVLAVGDAEFQNKCLGKMNDVATSGRTVLFVSHNMAAVEALCSHCLLLSGGSLRASGPVPDVVGDYLRSPSEVDYDIDLATHSHRIPGATPLFTRLRFLGDSGEVLSQVGLGTDVTAVLELSSPGQRVPSICVALHLYNMLGHRIVTYHTAYQFADALDLAGNIALSCRMPNVRLMPGTYNVVAALASGGPAFDRIDPATQIEVVARDVYGTGRVPSVKDGVFVPDASWSVEAV